MHIHFVCTGNTYRSRLAEAYLSSKKLSGVIVSSSGIEANDNIFGPICWEAQRLLEVTGLVPFMSNHWTQTTTATLKADLVVFMEQAHFEFASKNCDFSSSNFVIWDVPDLDELKTHEMAETIEKVTISEQTFKLIRQKVDALVKQLRS